MYIAGRRGRIQGGIIRESLSFKGSARDARQTYKAVHSRFEQFYGRFYRHKLSFTDTRMEFTGFIGLYPHKVQLFLVLATYYVVSVLFLLLSTLLSAKIVYYNGTPIYSLYIIRYNL